MLLENKVAVVYGAGGAVGRAVARTFAGEGARVFLAGRTASKLRAAAHDLTGADTSVVDALDPSEVDRHLDEVIEKAGRIDVSFNAVGIDNGEQGVPLHELTADDYCRAIGEYVRTHFTTARAAAVRMIRQRSGVILPLSNPMARQPAALSGCFGQYGAAVESMARQMAAELAPYGIRVVCVRPTGMPEAATEMASITREVWARAAERLGVPFDQLLATIGETPLGRPLRTAEVAQVAAFAASDRASGMTGTVANVTCGAVAD